MFGQSFTLLIFADRDHDRGGSLAEAARTRNIPLAVVHVPASRARDLYAADYALIPPDQHVAWRGNQLPASGDGLWNVVVGGPAVLP